MKRIISAILLFCILLFTLTACQKTPEVDIVIQKDMEQMLELAQETPDVSSVPQNAAPQAESPLIARLHVPERYSPEITSANERLTITVDAAVRVPNAIAMPIARVRPIQFSQEVVSAFFERFCGDIILYDTTPSGFTKYQLEENILMYANRVNERTGSEREAAKKKLDFLETELAGIPADTADMVSDGTLREMIISTSKPDVGRYMGVSAVEKPFGALRESKGVAFSARNDPGRMDYDDESVDWGKEIGASLSYGTNRNYGEDNGEESYKFLLDETAVPENARGSLALTPAEARAMVEEAMTGLPVELMTDGVYLMEKRFFKQEVIDGETCIYDEFSDEPPRFAYVVTLGQPVGSVPCRNVMEAEANNFKTETSLTPSWFYERIRCIVTDDGIESFYWRSPMDIMEIVTPDANLLPFSEIAAIAERMLPVIYGGQIYDEIVSVTAKIDRVQLELQRVTEENAIEYGLVIPVWNFYGECLSVYDGGTDSSRRRYELPDSLLTVNAIDGSIIDVERGY
ncbi:MAG: DUF6034 family protein [Clostridia bacterium]